MIHAEGTVEAPAKQGISSILQVFFVCTDSSEITDNVRLCPTFRGAGIADLSAGAQLGLGITAIGCLTPYQIGLRSLVSTRNNSTTKGENNRDLH